MKFTGFLRDTLAGSTAIMAAAVAVMTILGAAVIVDHQHLVAGRDVVQNAARAAGLAATLELSRMSHSATDEEVLARMRPVAQRYAELNVKGNRPNLPGDVSVSLAIDRDAGTVTATVSATSGQTLVSGGLLGEHGPGAIGRGVRSEGKMEEANLILAIDMSGSMKYDLQGLNIGETRISIVKRAATDLVNALPDHVAVGIVPWFAVVRLDEAARERWVDEGWAVYPQSRRYKAGTHDLPAAPEDWKGCLDEHRGDDPAQETTARLATPGTTPFAQGYFTSFPGYAYECNVEGAWFCHVPGMKQQPGCGGSAILPPTTDHAAVLAAINGLLPQSGRTHSASGILWSQRLLEPDWADVWGTDARLRNIIVLLTDGEDTWCQAGDAQCVSRATACAVAKEAGSEIFVIAAMDPKNISTALEEGLEDCATDEDSVFVNNATAESLEAAFSSIKRRLLKVRVLTETVPSTVPASDSSTK